MKLIDSFEEYAQLTKGIRFENNGFTIEQIKTHIQDNRMWHKRIHSRQVFLLDEKAFMQLIISKPMLVEGSSPKESSLFPEISIPIVCYLVNEQSGKNQLEEWGFRCECRSDKYGLSLEEFVNSELSLEVLKQEVRLDTFNICFQTKNQEEFQQIMLMWEDYLPIVEVPIMNYEEFKKLEKNEQIILIKDKNKDLIVAACYYDTFFKTSTIHHVVVYEPYRKQQLASALIRVWLKKLVEKEVKKAVAWIEEDNGGSQKTFEKYGFEKSSIQSYQYIR